MIRLIFTILITASSSAIAEWEYYESHSCNGEFIEGTCFPSAGGNGFIAAKPFNDHAMVTVSIGGRNLECMVDTGASVFAIPQGMKVGNAVTEVQLQTAAGPRWSPIYRIPEINIGGYKFQNVAAAQLPTESCLLGMNILKFFSKLIIEPHGLTFEGIAHAK